MAMGLDLAAQAAARVTNHYKIRRKSDGFFSSGGTYGYFDEVGKDWKSLKGLRLHIANCCENSKQYGSYVMNNDISDLEVVTIRVTEEEVGVAPLIDEVVAQLERRKEAELKRTQAQAEQNLRRAEQEYERAKSVIKQYEERQHG